MAKLGYYLDTRSVSTNGTYPLKLRISHQGRTSFFPVEVSLKSDEWDKRGSVVVKRGDTRVLNSYLGEILRQSQSLLLDLRKAGVLDRLTIEELKAALRPSDNAWSSEGEDTGLYFLPRLRRFSSRKSAGTRRLYEETARRIEGFCERQRKRSELLQFSDISKSWLEDFDAFLSKSSPSRNARNIHFRNIRAVFNDALDDDLEIPYPFRRFKLRTEQTAKRSLSVNELRRLFSAPVEGASVRHLDFFKLSFFLMGINIGDLCKLKGMTGEYIEFHRAKTHRFYRMRVEPEALAIIERYRGQDWLLDVLDRNKDYRSFYRHLNAGLKRIGDVHTNKHGKKEVFSWFPKISTYWARHSWATIAASLDIPKETIAAALGHGKTTVTDIYIDFDQRKVEQANRMVIDWVLYGRR